MTDGWHAALARIASLEKALTTIRDTYGQVCADFDICDHAACRASYSAWEIARSALEASAVPTDRDDMAEYRAAMQRGRPIHPLARASAAPEPTDLRALSDAATPGPWVADVPGFGTIFTGETIETRDAFLFDPREATYADSALVVAAVNYVRARLAATPPGPHREDR